MSSRRSSSDGPNLVGQSLLADFRASGLYHCLAVDGLKVSTIALARSRDRAPRGLGRRAAEVAALAAVAAYALAVGLHPSVVRAGIAATLGSLAWLAARQRDRWQALLVGAAVLLAWNPYALLDAGFQLSFAAVAAIFVVTPRVVRALEGYPVSHALAQLIGVSTACGLATAPVTWLQFRQISLVTVPANVVAVPVVVEVLGLALVTAAIAPVAPPRRVRARVAQRLGRVVRRRVRARVREPAGRADHVRPLGRRARPGRGRGSRLCLAAWRTSAR